MVNSNMFTKNEDALFSPYIRTGNSDDLGFKSYANTSNTVNTEETTQESKPDMINHPPHYTQGNIECIEVISYINEQLNMQGFEGYCLGNFIKYIWRCNNKNGWEDIDKAIFYLDRLLTEQNND